MRIVYFGNADFGTPTLDALLHSPDHSLLTIITNPDKKSGRGKLMTPTPIKRWAINHNIDILEVKELNNYDFINKLKELKADIFIVIAYRILPLEIFNIPKLGTMNLHASILPLYRGAAPIQRAILNGEKYTGVSTFIINEKVDRGNIILQEKISIGDKENYSTLYSKLSHLGSKLVIESMKNLKDNHLLKVQDKKATYAKKIAKEELQIDWNNSVTNILNQIRAFSVKPGAYSILNNKRLKILEAEISNLDLDNLKVGEIDISKGKLNVKAKEGSIEIKLLQPEGKSVVSSNDFINGYFSNNKEIVKFEYRQ